MTITVPFTEVFAYLLMAGAVVLLLIGVGFEIFDAEKRRLVPKNRFLRILRWFVPSLLCFEDTKDMQAFSRFTAVVAVGCILLSAFMMTQYVYDSQEVMSNAKLGQVFGKSLFIVTWPTYVVTMGIKLALTLIKAIVGFIKG